MAIPLIIKRIAIFLGYDVGVQEGNIRKTMAARGLVNGRSPLRRSGRDLVFRCYPPELLSPHKKTEADLLGQPHPTYSFELKNRQIPNRRISSMQFYVKL